MPDLIRLTHAAAVSQQFSRDLAKMALTGYWVSASPGALSRPVKMASVLLEAAAVLKRAEAKPQSRVTSPTAENISMSTALLGTHRRFFKSV